MRLSSYLLLGFGLPLAAHLFLPFDRKEQILVLWSLSVSMVVLSMLLSWLESWRNAEPSTAGPKFLLADIVLLWLLAIGFHGSISPKLFAFGINLRLLLPYTIALGLFCFYVPFVWKPSKVTAPRAIAAAGLGAIFLAFMILEQAIPHHRPSITSAMFHLGALMGLTHLVLRPPAPENVGRVMSAVSAACAFWVIANVMLNTPLWGLVACAIGVPCAVSGAVRPSNSKHRAEAIGSLLVMALFLFVWWASGVHGHSRIWRM